MKYEKFIDDLKNLIDEAHLLNKVPYEFSHYRKRFRKWRNDAENTISSAKEHGYKLPGDFKSNQRLYMSPNQYADKPANWIYFSKDIEDSIIELEFIVNHYTKHGVPLTINTSDSIVKPQGAIARDKTDLLVRFKQHWLISLVLLCVAVAGATWGVAIHLLVSPRDFEIARLEKQLQQAKEININTSLPSGGVLLDTGIPAGVSVTTADGLLSIHVENVMNDSVTLNITFKAEQSTIFKNVPIGRRISVKTVEGTYYIDFRRIRGNIVDVTVSK